jgi:hypothetical protein
MNVITQINEQCLCRVADLIIAEAWKVTCCSVATTRENRRRECHTGTAGVPPAMSAKREQEPLQEVRAVAERVNLPKRGPS